MNDKVNFNYFKFISNKNSILQLHTCIILHKFKALFKYTLQTKGPIVYYITGGGGGFDRGVCFLTLVTLGGLSFNIF